MKKMIKEFKEFAIKGNMMDMAIGIVIGASFNKIIDVLVKKVILPPFTLFSDGIELENKKIVLRELQKNASGEVLQSEVFIGYGALIEAFLDFAIIGFTLFVVVKVINRLRNRADDVDDTTVTTPKNIELLTKISDSLEKQNELLENKK